MMSSSSIRADLPGTEDTGPPGAREISHPEAVPPPIPTPSVGAHDADPGPHTLPSMPLRVVVTSGQRLLADMAAAALAGVGVHTTTVDWPTTASTGAARRRLLAFRPHVCLSLHDRESQVAARVGDLLRTDDPVPWVVLATGDPGPAWAGALLAGAHAVLPGRLTMTELVVALRRAAVRGEVMDPAQRSEVLRAWGRAREREQELVGRMETLTPRELSVLQCLYEGERVGAIARASGVSQATVRSQVKSLLRKLGLNSQLAAVAAYRGVRTLVQDDAADPANRLWSRAAPDSR